MANRTNSFSIEFRPFVFEPRGKGQSGATWPIPCYLFFTKFYGIPWNLKFDLQVAISSFDSFLGPYQCRDFVHVIACLWKKSFQFYTRLKRPHTGVWAVSKFYTLFSGFSGWLFYLIVLEVIQSSDSCDLCGSFICSAHSHHFMTTPAVRHRIFHDIFALWEAISLFYNPLISSSIFNKLRKFL